MRIAGHHVSSMYVWTIVLLVLLAGVAAYISGTFPVALAFATTTGIVIDSFIDRFYLKRQFRLPASGMISGLIIGSVAPLNAPLLLVLFAVIFALLSKHFIKTKHGNLLNPAAFGLLIALFLFSVGDDWWAAASFNVYGIALTITPLLAIVAYKAHRLTASASFIAVSLVIGIVLSHFAISPQSLLVSLLGINFLFAFVMVVEPKTSPHSQKLQAVYGAGIAVIYLLLASYGVTYSILIALIVGNIAYSAYRIYRKRAGAE